MFLLYMPRLCVPDAQGGHQKRVDPLEQESQRIGTGHVGAGLNLDGLEKLLPLSCLSSP